MTLQQRLADKLYLEKSGDGHYYHGLCPFHDDHHPSFLLYPDYFICRSASCGKQGKIERLETLLQILPVKVSSVQKSSISPRWKQWENRYGDIDNIAYIAHQNVLKGNDIYFKKRKLDKFIEQGMFGLLDGWITIPIFDRKHEIIDIVARAIRQPNVKYFVRSYETAMQRPLYCPNWGRIAKSDHLYLVYGIFTVWALEAIGEPAITGITGKFHNPDVLDEFQIPITVIPDYNEEKTASQLVNRLGWRGRLKMIDWPDDCEDLDDVRRIYGNDSVKSLVGANNG